MLATFGIVARLHETVAETALFALVGALLLSLVVALDEEWKGSVAAGLVLAAAALTRGWLPAGLLAIAAAAGLPIASRDALAALGHPVQWHTYPMPHSVHPREIAEIAAFLKQVLPA